MANMKIEEVLKQLDDLFETNRMDEVEDFLGGRLKEAIAEDDTSSVITIINEMIGFFRDTGQDEKSVAYSKKVISLMEQIGLAGTVPFATTLLNAANAYRAAGLLSESLAYYKQVFEIYEENLQEDDFRFASLQNNFSLLYQEMGEFDKAVESLKQALQIVKKYPESRFELAVTYTNLGASLIKLGKYGDAKEQLEEALALFHNLQLKDSHYCAALASMAEIWFHEEEYEKAVQCYESVLALLEINTGKTKSYDRIMESLELVYQKWGKKREYTGLELSEKFYLEFGAPMIHEKFPEYEDKIAVGLVGEGSECFGYDDALSRDHDFGAGFCMWVSKETYLQIGNRLQEAYEKLPKTYMGISRISTKQGQNRMGVWEIGAFYKKLLGINHPPETEVEWLYVEESKLAETVNGKVFRDDEGIFTNYRNTILKYYPEKIWLKKTAQELVLFSQSGQYNYFRMLKRKDKIGAALSLRLFVEHAINLSYLMNRRYAPYYKWKARGMQYFTRLSGLHARLEQLVRLDSEEKESESRQLIEEIAAEFLKELKMENLAEGEETYLEYYAAALYERAEKMNRKKEDLVEEIVKMEWEAFDKVENEGGRASCQNNFPTFSIMRKSQYLAWKEDMLIQYLMDFKEADLRGWNMITEKYARMMESTAPEKYNALKEKLPFLSDEKKAIIEEIVKVQVEWMEEFAAQNPKMAQNARTIHTSEDSESDTSYETYLRGEISTYSDTMLLLYGRFIAETAKKGQNLAEIIMTNTAHLYGYASLMEAEASL